MSLYEPTQLPGRQALQRWEAAKPSNYYTSDASFQRWLRLYLGETLDAHEEAFSAFGETVATVIGPLLKVNEQRENLPRLERYTHIGERCEAVQFHPNYHEAGRHIWRSGILAVQRDPGRLFEQAALFYLLTHEGEGGHACPIACTAGLIRALQQHGSDDLKARYLPPLLERDYDRAHRGAQFLTEIQGGSDVGANIVRAEPAVEYPGAWRITGEKWFCSVIDADQFLMTARPVGAPAGTKGLGCFLVPRRLPDGSLNRFFVRRLKDKLGTRLMASAETDFDGALAWPIGELSQGFKIAVGLVLNTSRWMNALACAGIMRRAFIEADTFATYREAFGAPIRRYPMVQENLAFIRVLTEAALASTLALTAIFNRLDDGSATPADKAVFRFLVNANKYITAVDASEAVHRAIDVLGGNGAIEDFSILPRLYRDQVVLENWEGTPNVLALQVMRDLARLNLVEPVVATLRAWLAEVNVPALAAEKRATEAALEAVLPPLGAALTETDQMQAHARRLTERLMRVVQATLLLRRAQWDIQQGAPTDMPDVAGLFIKRFLVPGYDPLGDAEWTTRLAQLTTPLTDTLAVTS